MKNSNMPTTRKSVIHAFALILVALLASLLLAPNQAVAQSFYIDADRDGYGAADSPAFPDDAGGEFVPNNDDCNDGDPDINPDATEVADGEDNNCDGNVDEGLSDTTAPTVESLLRQMPLSQYTNADELTWRFTFDEPVLNVDASEFGAQGTTASLSVTGSGAVYDVTLSGGDLASLNGTVGVGVQLVGNDIQDLAGNAFEGAYTGAIENTYIVDNSADSVLITTPSDLVSGEFRVTLTFQANGPASAAAAGQTSLSTVLNALQITNANRTGSSAFGGSTVIFNLTPTAPGPVTVSLPANVANDYAGNGNAASNTLSVTAADLTAPIITVPDDIVIGTDPGEATAVVNYATPTARDNVAVTSGPILTAGFLSGATFPLGVTTVTYEASDADGNTGNASFTVTVEDREAPVIRPISNVSFEADPSGTREIGFGTIVDDNVDTGITPVFRLDGNIIASPYDFPAGLNVITINATDTAGNPATEVIFNLTITAGVGPDVPLITTADINANRSMTIGGSAEVDSTVRVTFPNDSFQEVTATGGVYNVTSAADMQGGTVTVTATDARGYTSGAATVDLFPDYDAPTVTITGAPSLLTDTTPFMITISFSEPVLNFVQGDMTVSGATVTSFGGSERTYTAEITPVAGQDIAISVPAGVAEDAAANLNLASAVVNITAAALTRTEQLITTTTKLFHRNLIGTQPDLGYWLNDPLFGRIFISASQGEGNFDFATSSERSVWAAGQGRWSTEGDMETSYANIAVGAHYELQPNVLVGVMAQFDSGISDEGTARIETSGWLIGPYAIARLENHPLIVSGSYLAGQSDNSISPHGTYEDQFGSDRSILTLGVSGEIIFERLALRPLLDFARVADETDAYTDGESNPVRAQTITTTEATVGLDFVMPVPVNAGELFLTGGMGSTLSRVDEPFVVEETSRGNANFGFRYMLESAGSLTARATYDGIGDDSYEALGAQIAFELSF